MKHKCYESPKISHFLTKPVRSFFYISLESSIVSAGGRNTRGLAAMSHVIREWVNGPLIYSRWRRNYDCIFTNWFERFSQRCMTQSSKNCFFVDHSQTESKGGTNQQKWLTENWKNDIFFYWNWTPLKPFNYLHQILWIHVKEKIL